MRKQDFENSPSGHLVPTEKGQWAFVPDHLPPKGIDVAHLAPQLERASVKLGELNGICRTIPDPLLLIRPLQAKEALSSSSMEGTFSTVDDLMLIEAGGHIRDGAQEAREVANYRRALAEAVGSFEDTPLCLRTLRDAHRTLMHNVARHRGAKAVAGEFRTNQNFIGALEIEKARFVPPPPREALVALDLLEKYLHDEARPRLPDLIESALIHYQFETIHPFGDGNGRVGRMLIALHLLMRGANKSPVLYLSPTLETRKDDYIDYMYEVSKTGAWTPWVEFFLDMVEQATEQAVATADCLFALRERYRELLQQAGRSANLLKIVDLLFVTPVVTIPAVATHLGVTYRAAQLNTQTLQDVGILWEVPHRTNPKYFAAVAILDTIAGRQPADARTSH